MRLLFKVGRYHSRTVVGGLLLKIIGTYIGEGLKRFNFRAQTAAEFTCTDLHANEIIWKWLLERFIYILWFMSGAEDTILWIFLSTNIPVA